MIKIYAALMVTSFLLIGGAAFAQANKTPNQNNPASRNASTTQIEWSTW